MSFTLGKAVNPTNVFLTALYHLEARWDPKYYRYMRDFEMG
jgi:hypothetical protein